MRSDVRLRLKLSDKSKALLDKGKKDGTVSKLTVNIEATHSGIVNGNKWFYTPAGMEDGASTFTSPYPKPVLIAHDRHEDAVGRVIASEYVAYDNAEESGIGSTLDSKTVTSAVKGFTKSETFLADGYKGLGHIMLKVEITDSGAIEKLLDERYLTVSISGDTQQAVCSTCGVDAKNPVDNEDECSHWRGEIYDGEESFLIAGAMTISEVSFVNVPADSNAKVQSISDGLSLADSIEAKELEIVDFVITNKGDTNLKIKIKDLTSDSKLQDNLDAHLKSLGLGDGVQTEEDLLALRKTSFLFADTRSVPLNTGHAMIAAYHALDSVEESDDKAALLSVLDTRWKKSFGAKTMDEAIEWLKSESKTDKDDGDKTVSIGDADHTAIADKVLAGMKALFDMDDSFLASRHRQLEEDLMSVVDENTEMLVTLKDVTINQIMDKENPADKESYRVKLTDRSIDSLSDKLKDLTEAATKPNDIVDPNVNIDDAASGIGDAADDADGTNKPAGDAAAGDAGGQTLTEKMIRDEYRSLIKKEGLSAASLYLKGLRDSDKMPKDFSFK